jgi:hypothetical protein
MSAFRLVAGEQAGPDAIGVLVPPGRRTFVIVRPRRLALDLLVLAEAAGNAFREFEREQACRAAEALVDRLTDDPSAVSINLQKAPADGQPAIHLRVQIGPFHLLVCARNPGQPYAPLRFVDDLSARATCEQIRELFTPRKGNEQEYYLNTRQFER